MGDFKKEGGAGALFAPVLAFKPKLAAAMVALLAGGLLQLAFPYFTQLLVDATWLDGAGKTGWQASVDAISLVLFGIAMVILVCIYFDSSLFGEVGERLVAKQREAVFGRLVRVPMRFYSGGRVGELSSRVLADLAMVQEFWTTDLRTGLRQVVIVTGSVALMFMTSAKLSVAVFAVVPVAVLVGVFFGRKIRGVSTRTQAGLAESAVVFGEALNGIEGVKVFGNEGYEEKRFHERVLLAMGHGIRGARLRALFLGMILAVMFGAWVFVMWFGSKMIMTGEVGVGAFMSFMFYLFFAGGATGSLADVFGKFQRVLGANDRIRELLVEGEEEAGDERAVEIEGRVEYDGVDFCYPGRGDVVVLESVSFSVQAGECVALVGPSGAGKSTVVSLLFRLFEVSGGEIRIDGRPVGDYGLRALRERMALVPQEVHLFGGTLRENIAYGRPGASDGEVEAAAKQAELDGFAASLPEGYDTPLGDRGAQLSGGQRQRVAIARAILKDPAILVLDEATSALDTESERLVQAALDKLMEGRTSFVIAHRLNTVRKADRILVVRGGCVVESGTHEELTAAGGFYRYLCEEQLGGG